MTELPAAIEGSEVSVVIGSNGGAGTVAAFLTALEPQRDGAEVIVCEPGASPDEVRARFPWARFIERAGAPVPELWSTGIAEATGTAVALSISPMQPDPEWVRTIREQLAIRPVIAGAIEPASDIRLRDYAEYLCRYSHDMLPFAAHACDALPGDNSAYRADALKRVAEHFHDGFWEPEVNRELKALGMELWHTPDLVVQQGRSAGAIPFLRQRLVHGAAHGRQRGARFSPIRNLAGVLATPLVTVLLTWRIIRRVRDTKGHPGRALQALPLIFAFNAAWAIGEARGHAAMLRRR